MSDLSSSIENPGQANNDSKNAHLIQHTDVQNRDELIGERPSCCARKFNSTIDMLDNTFSNISRSWIRIVPWYRNCNFWGTNVVFNYHIIYYTTITKIYL